MSYHIALPCDSYLQFIVTVQKPALHSYKDAPSKQLQFINYTLWKPLPP